MTAIHNLPHPSTVGVISISTVFLKTARGLLAPAIGGRHSFQEFLLQLPAAKAVPNVAWVARQETEEQKPRFAMIRWELPARKSKRGTPGTPNARSETGRRGGSSFASCNDLRGIDLLFCDSIAYEKIAHPNRILYRLISQHSLQEAGSWIKALTKGSQPGRN